MRFTYLVNGFYNKKYISNICILYTVGNSERQNNNQKNPEQLI